MIQYRRQGLSVCLLIIPVLLLWGSVAAAQDSPFEQVPQEDEPGAPAEAQSPFETPTEAPGQPPGEIGDVIEAIEFRGSRRVPQDTLRFMIFSRAGDRYDEDALRRDFISLWNSGRFDDVRMSRERGAIGWIVRFDVVERPVIATIDYEGLKSVQMSEILERFQERRVGLTVSSQYEPDRVQRAAMVLQEFLAERGRQFATVEPQIQRVPPSSIAVTFNVEEGPRVRVGKIDIEGNSAYSDKQVIRSMKLLKPIGVPHSIFVENLFSKSYDENKLFVDQELIRDFYQQRGYFRATVLDHEVTMRDVGGGKFRVPLIYPNRLNKRADVAITVEEGRKYYLRNIRFEGVRQFQEPQALFPPLFGMGSGDVFSSESLRTGLDNLRKLYSRFGYIDFVAEPLFDFPGDDQLDLTLSVEEGDMFFIRRIDFAGNSTTRDKVIRRELLLDEGNVFNSDLWELSVLRLNQLGYFEPLDAEEDVDMRRDTQNKTVDLTVNVKEQGKNTVQMSGGVSGLAGTFLSFGYATNNFLGLGETLSIDTQLGSRMQSVTFGFTEPYLFGRPIQSGFTVSVSRFDFDQGRELSILTGTNLSSLFESINADNRLNYVTQGHGFSVFLSYPLRRTFARVGLTYGYSVQDVEPVSAAAEYQFRYSNYLQFEGPNSLEGIRTSRIVPSFNYNTVDHPITPSSGRQFYISTSFSGIGGNVRTVQPTVDIKWFRRGLRDGHVMGFHLLGRAVTGYGGVEPPPFNRFFMGGENDIRGFDVWGITPVAWMPSSTSVNVLNADGSYRQQKTVVDDEIQLVPVTMEVPVYRLTYPGGDASLVGNYEYRIPIMGPVTLALFADAGVNRIIFPNQLQVNSGYLDALNGAYPQASFERNAIVVSETTKLRSSVGVEFQVLMPVVNAPFRLYWAYNPNIVRTYLQPPVVADRSMFPNQATFLNTVLLHSQSGPWVEDRTTFRFSVGRTF